MRIEEKDGAFVIVDFNEMEAYKIACKIEKDGIVFYEDLIQTSKDDATRQALEILLKEEKKHFSFFDTAIFDLRESEWYEKEDDLIDAMDYGIFPDHANEIDAEKFVSSPEKALGLGIVMENRSIQFYEACREKVCSEKAKEKISLIIDKEQEHKDILKKILKDMKQK